MPGNQLFEYAVIRVVPRVEREEFLNVGIILYCSKQRFLKVVYTLEEARLRAAFPDLDLEAVRENLESLHAIAGGDKGSGLIGALDMPSRFRWLTAWRSTVVQTSRVHPGLCSDAEAALHRLFAQMVG